MEIFKIISKSRILTEKELQKKLQTPMDQADLSGYIKKLEVEGLIDSKEAAVSDWNKYFVTADGLAVERLLK